MDPDVAWRNGRGCPPVVHYGVDLQLVHVFSCYDNTLQMRIVPNAKCQWVLAFALWLVTVVVMIIITVIYYYYY